MEPKLMLVYLVRHGKAERHAATSHDGDRVLTARGRAQGEWIGRAIEEGDPAARPSLILCSGYARAFETARSIGGSIGLEPSVEPILEPGGPVEQVIALVRDQAAAGHDRAIMLVGHNPQMEMLLVRLVPGPAGAQTQMRTGMMAVVELPDPAAITAGGRLRSQARMDD